MRNIFYLLYLKLSLSFVILFSLSATSQEKKIIKALNALEKGKYTEWADSSNKCNLSVVINCL